MRATNGLVRWLFCRPWPAHRGCFWPHPGGRARIPRNSTLHHNRIQYPIVFAKNPETGRFAPYVLMGLTPEENLFWNRTELDVCYVPLNIRRQPFYVGGESAVCVDLDSPCLDEGGTKSLLDRDGSDSAHLKSILTILGELIAGRAPTEQLIATLLSLELLAPLLLDIVLDDGTPLKIQGLYGIDEDRFRQLATPQLSGLWSSGGLDLIYAVLLASGQIFKQHWRLTVTSLLSVQPAF